MELKMYKLEVIHNKNFLNTLRDLQTGETLKGFTTLSVHHGFGTLKGEYKADHFGDEQYLTIVILENEQQVQSLIKLFKQRASSNKIICLTSQVECDLGC
jgi:PII-like signaling protein